MNGKTDQVFETPFSANGRKLFLLGFATLFLELALIRYLAGNIWNLGYFPNLVLMAVFVGMGLGFVFHHYISDRVSPILFQASLLLLALLLVFVYVGKPVVPNFANWEGLVGGELYFTAPSEEPSEGNYLPFVACFLFTILIFALMSQRTAKLFRQFRPLTAYTLDIAGSCSGILSFMVVSWLSISPPAWFAFFTILFIATMSDSWKTRWIPILPGLLLVFICISQDQVFSSAKDYEGPFQSIWSPYQKIEFVEKSDSPKVSSGGIFVNGLSHQYMKTKEDITTGFYQKIYDARAEQTDLPPYRNVMIIGAGSGNDVSAALINGVDHVDAVEIDPIIASLGQKYHPYHPYQNPKVDLTVDDGRAFLTQADKRYDLIVFALTDSLVRVSSMSQLRMENYLFTEQSVRRAFNLLSDQGDVILYNYYRQPWLVAKIRDMIIKATGRKPFITLHKKSMFSILRVGKYFPETAMNPDVLGGQDTPTDDWPFLYLQKRGIPPVYLKTMLGMSLFVAILVFLMHYISRKNDLYGSKKILRIKLAFIFMGIAFLLLETKSVIQFSLLFGTTWLNNSLVFLAVLILVLLANWTAYLIKDPRKIWVIYLLLLLSCLSTLVYPLGNLLSVQNPVLRFFIASLMTFSPIFFANLIFSITFRDQRISEHIFGWNLIGAVIGGILEYSSLSLGYNLLTLIVAIAYTIVFLLIIEARKLEHA